MEKMLRRLIPEDIHIATALDPGLGRVLADPGRISQVVMNLAVNSRDAMPRGGRLTIETANIVLGEDFARTHPEVRPGRYVLVAVRDTGEGMTEEVKAHLFEPFFTTKGPGKGTGLGLATVYGIVQQAGGYVYAESEPGRGTTMKVYLPRVEAAAPLRKSQQGLARAPGGGETILLAEDEESVRRLAVQVLQSKGYRVLEACDGEEATWVAERHVGDLHMLVTDVVMPRLGGRELAERLAAERPGLRVLYLSGYADDAVVRHGVLEEEMAFLEKPFSPEALARKVREVLDQ
jgi:CheY-like chemotaxis protein